MDDSSTSLRAMAQDGRAAARAMASMSGEARDEALLAMRRSLDEAREVVSACNAEDKAQASRDKIDAPLLRRLDIEGAKYDAMLAKIDDVHQLADPLAAVSYACELVDGLQLFRVACPIGVICVIFESRPEAAVQIAALALKSANAVILKGGREAANTNAALVAAMQGALRAGGVVPAAAVQLVETREEIGVLLGLHDVLDLVIPRGSKALVSHIMASTRIPVMGHADGICSVYLDRAADPAKAARVAVDSKIDYPVACNAAETLLVHRDVIGTAWPAVAAGLLGAGVALRVDAECLAALRGAAVHRDEWEPLLRQAAPADFDTEFLALTMAVRARKGNVRWEGGGLWWW